MIVVVIDNYHQSYQSGRVGTRRARNYHSVRLPLPSRDVINGECNIFIVPSFFSPRRPAARRLAHTRVEQLATSCVIISKIHYSFRSPTIHCTRRSISNVRGKYPFSIYYSFHLQFNRNSARTQAN